MVTKPRYTATESKRVISQTARKFGPAGDNTKCITLKQVQNRLNKLGIHVTKGDTPYWVRSKWKLPTKVINAQGRGGQAVQVYEKPFLIKVKELEKLLSKKQKCISINQIAEVFGTTNPNVNRQIRIRNIPIVDIELPGLGGRKWVDKEVFSEALLTWRGMIRPNRGGYMTTQEAAARFNLSSQLVHNRLIKAGIPTKLVKGQGPGGRKMLIPVKLAEKVLGRPKYLNRIRGYK